MTDPVSQTTAKPRGHVYDDEWLRRLMNALPPDWTEEKKLAQARLQLADIRPALAALLADYYRDHPLKHAGEWGRAIFETAKADADFSAFKPAWDRYIAGLQFSALPDHDRALIRVAFVAGWRAATNG